MYILNIILYFTFYTGIEKTRELDLVFDDTDLIIEEEYIIDKLYLFIPKKDWITSSKIKIIVQRCKYTHIRCVFPKIIEILNLIDLSID